MAIPTALTEPQSPARFTTAEFARMCEVDAFGDMNVELIEGVLHRFPLPINRHGALQARLIFGLVETAGKARLLGRVGIDLGNATVVACDVAVLHEANTSEDHWLLPGEVQLVVEIAADTFDRDYFLKRRLYASAGIPTYWVVDVNRQVIPVFDRPDGGDYLGIDLVRFGEPLAVPESNATITLE